MIRVAGTLATFVLLLHTLLPAPVAADDKKAAGATTNKPPERQVTVTLGSKVVQESGEKHCTLSDPMPAPASYPKDTRVLACAIELDPSTQSLAVVEFTGMDFATLRIKSSTCQDYSIIMGNPKVRRVAISVERADGKPFLSGKYELHVKVDGDVKANGHVLPFTIK